MELSNKQKNALVALRFAQANDGTLDYFVEAFPGHKKALREFCAESGDKTLVAWAWGLTDDD